MLGLSFHDELNLAHHHLFFFLSLQVNANNLDGRTVVFILYFRAVNSKSLERLRIKEDRPKTRKEEKEQNRSKGDG